MHKILNSNNNKRIIMIEQINMQIFRRWWGEIEVASLDSCSHNNGKILQL